MNLNQSRQRRFQPNYVDLEESGEQRYDFERLELTIANLRQQLDISRNREKRLSTALDLSGYRVAMEAPDSDSENLLTFSAFLYSFLDRMGWLVGLMIFQSFSSLILQSHEELLQKHPVIVNFLTMLIGAGGNAGSQATVRVIRGIAIGSLNKDTTMQFIWSEVKMGIALCITVGIAGVLRTLVGGNVSVMETIAVACALVTIVFVSILVGVCLPLLFQQVGLDPAHSSTAINVVMDIGGVLIIVAVAEVLLETSPGASLVDLLSGNAAVLPNMDEVSGGIASATSAGTGIVGDIVSKLREGSAEILKAAG